MDWKYLRQIGGHSSLKRQWDKVYQWTNFNILLKEVALAKANHIVQGFPLYRVRWFYCTYILSSKIQSILKTFPYLLRFLTLSSHSTVMVHSSTTKKGWEVMYLLMTNIYSLGSLNLLILFKRGNLWHYYYSQSLIECRDIDQLQQWVGLPLLHQPQPAPVEFAPSKFDQVSCSQ